MANLKSITNFTTNNVHNVCKTMLTIKCISKAKLSAKQLLGIFSVQNYSFRPTFPYFPTHFPTIFSPLISPMIFHYSTDPTTNTTINNLIERRKKNED